MCSKLHLSHSKWVLQAILSLTVLSNCVSGSSNFDTAFFLDCNNVNLKNVLKTAIFSFQVGFISDFVPNCPLKSAF